MSVADQNDWSKPLANTYTNSFELYHAHTHTHTNTRGNTIIFVETIPLSYVISYFSQSYWRTAAMDVYLSAPMRMSMRYLALEIYV